MTYAQVKGPGLISLLKIILKTTQPLCKDLDRGYQIIAGRPECGTISGHDTTMILLTTKTEPK